MGEERTLKGSYLGSGIPSRDVLYVLELHRSIKMPFDKLLTHRLKFAGINEGFDRLESCAAIRQLVAFE